MRDCLYVCLACWPACMLYVLACKCVYRLSCLYASTTQIVHRVYACVRAGARGEESDERHPSSPNPRGVPHCVENTECNSVFHVACAAAAHSPCAYGAPFQRSRIADALNGPSKEACLCRRLQRGLEYARPRAQTGAKRTERAECTQLRLILARITGFTGF